MTEVKPRRSRALLWYTLTVVLIAAGTFLLTMLLMNIRQRKEEGQQYYYPIADLDNKDIDPKLWKMNFPRHYDAFTDVETRATDHGGSAMTSKLKNKDGTDTAWVRLFAGYAFAVEYNDERGHPFMLEDQKSSRRVKEFKQYGACLHCHSSVIDAYRKAGDGNVWDGFVEVCKKDLKTEAFALVEHPVACVDCHDPKTMQLRVERPAFLKGLQALAESDDPVPHLPSIKKWRDGKQKSPYNPNDDASRQEMRSFVCAQCHVEYYFKGEGKLLTYPWKRGLKADKIEDYYNEDAGHFTDWKHAESKAPLLKAQHPDFELWSQGIHARAGVSCADCHMPYMRQGAIKISDHFVRSPLFHINRSCQTCHRSEEAELKERVVTIQNRTASLMSRGEKAILALLDALADARKQGAAESDLASALDFHRQAQWRLDFVAAENSMGFHAPQEAARLLGEAIDFARQGEASVYKALARKK